MCIRDRCGVLLISHDLHIVMAATDRVICLNGHVCCCGTPKTVASSQEYRDLFGDRAASSLAFYEHHHDHHHLSDGKVISKDGSVDENEYPSEGVSFKKFEHSVELNGVDSNVG